MTVHLDALLIFIGIGFLISMLLKTLWHRFVRFMKHVSYMKSVAGGTFVIDAEANYWLDLIKRRDYRAVWRWVFGEKWKKTHKQEKTKLLTEEDKRKIIRQRKIRKVAGISSGILVIGIIFVLLVPQFLVVENIETKATIFSTGNLDWMGGKLERTNRSFDVSLIFLIQRTDKIRDPKSVILTVEGMYVDVFDNVTNSTTNEPALYGVGFGKVNSTTLQLSEYVVSYNLPKSIYVHTQTLVKDGYELVFVSIGIRSDLRFPDCQQLAKITVNGESVLSQTPLSIYERGCPYSYGGKF